MPLYYFSYHPNQNQEILFSNLFLSGYLIISNFISCFICIYCVRHTLSYLCILSVSLVWFSSFLHCTIQPSGYKIFNKRLTYLFTYLTDTDADKCRLTHFRMYILISPTLDDLASTFLACERSNRQSRLSGSFHCF